MGERFPPTSALVANPRSLVGTWQLDRQLLDRRTGATGCFHGELSIAPASEALTWSESGELHWLGHTSQAYRELLLRPDDDGWWMHFADGRRFHPWRLDEPVTHPCGRDSYTGLITATPDRLRIVWRVTGPAKDQEIHTRLRRT